MADQKPKPAEEKLPVAQQIRRETMEATPWGSQGVDIQNYAQAKIWAEDIVKSGLAPRGMDRPEKVLVAIQTGTELGLSPMRALQSVIVVNGSATLRSTTITGLIQAGGHRVIAGCEVRDGVLTGFCRSQRKGSREWDETTFTQEDAQKARLWGKAGPWTEYPKRMLQHRAVGFHGRDYWGDVCHGLMSTDEAMDMQPQPLQERDVTPSASTVTGASDPLLDARTDDPPEPEGGTPIDVEVIEPEIDPETGEIVPSEEELEALRGA